MSRNFSAEVDAAMINSIVMVYMTIPVTLLTGAGTIIVTAWFNKETQKLAILSQRSFLRDKLLEKRMEIYPELRRLAFRLVDLRRQLLEQPVTQDLVSEERKTCHEMARFSWENKPFVSESVWKEADWLCFGFLTQEEIRNLNIPFIIRERSAAFRSAAEEQAELLERYFALYRAINEELDFQAVERDWLELRRG
jgi:hypothetical protein